MPDPAQYGTWWDALAAVGIAFSSALVTLGGVIGIQKKHGMGVKTIHDKSRGDIRALQDRCRDLEYEVKSLKEKVAVQEEDLKEAERKQEIFATLVFNKLDAIGKTLVKIQVAVGVAEE